MPGPGNRAKSKGKRPKFQGSSVVPDPPITRDPYVDDVDGADGWTPVVNILCDVFQLPDLTTRRGLKKVHANFEAIYAKLENAYQKNAQNERIRGGIVGIYAKMSVDSLLRNKLYHKGFLDKLIPLLEVESTQYMALRALVTVTHHGGAEIRASIATHSEVLTKLIEQHPDDEDICDMCVSVIAHSVGAVLEGGEDGCAFPEVLKTLDMRRILKWVMHSVTQPFVSRSLFEHATEFLASSTLHATAAYKSTPSATAYLVAGLRCRDWVLRCFCLGGLIRLHKFGSEDDQRFLDPQKLMGAVARGVPPRLNDVLMSYGPTNCELFLTIHTANDFQKAMVACVQDFNLYSLGLKLCKLILKTEFSISDGYFETINKRTGAREILDLPGLPFTRYSEALPHCAKAIRAKGNPGEADIADILDIKYKIMKGRVDEAAKHATQSLERSPQCAYYYYAISLSANHVNGLRSAKKGMKCKSITPFLRFQLMQRAVEHAGEMGLEILQKAPTAGEQQWEEGIAFLTSAYEDARTFLEEAPPDNRYMKNVSYWYILLTILMADKISPDLRELKIGLERLDVADQYSRFIGVTPPKTILRLTQETAVKLLPSAMKEFSPIFEKCTNTSETPKPPKTKLQDDLAAWLDNIRTEEGESFEQSHYCANPKINTNNVVLYRCSHCGNPSAALRKCSGCTKARYCDSTCQKAHWSEHKRSCKTA